MIRDLMEGPVLLGCFLVTHAVAALTGWLLRGADNRRQARGRVRAATDKAVAGRIDELVPKQAPRAD